MAENSHHSCDKQELSGSEKSTLADLINYNMGLAHNLYQVQDILTSLISVLVWKLNADGKGGGGDNPGDCSGEPPA